MSNTSFKLCLSLVLSVSATASAEPLVRMHSAYYYIDGPSAAVLAAQIEQQGPVAADGRRLAAKTKWDVQWKFNREQVGETCSMKDVVVAVGVAQTLPKWRGEPKGVASLRAHWKKFTAALLKHEDRHKEHGLRAGKEIEAALLAAKLASNCEDMQIAANAIAEQIVAKYREQDEDYDRQTRHGQSEGATLL
jgi:predicted secreted Zn-dependent protease